MIGSTKCHCHGKARKSNQTKKKATKHRNKKLKKKPHQPLGSKKWITPLSNPSNYCFGNAVVQMLGLLKIVWNKCDNLATLFQIMNLSKGAVSAKNFINMGFNPNNPSDAMALLNKILTKENSADTRWETQV